MTIALAIREATEALAGCSDTARLDAELLMAHMLGVSRSQMLIHHMKDSPPPAGFASLVVRRMRHEPVAYILGEQEFYGLDFIVTPAVLIPRADSETLIEVARVSFGEQGTEPKRILDLGTGSGALLLAALSIWPKAEGIGIDCSLEALVVAMRNAQRHANTAIAIVGNGPVAEPQHRGDRGFARMMQRDWNNRAWSAGLGQFDLILANPPYVEEAAELAPSVRDHEPAGALFAGAEGLDDYRILVPQLPALLTPLGVALIEIGATQAEAVTAIAEAAGLSTALHHDLAGRPRVIECKLALGNAAPSG